MRGTPFAVRLKTARLCAAIAIAGAALVPGARADESHAGHPAWNRLPSFVVASSLQTTRYDGVSDDLLTAGLGKTGLAGPQPAIANPAAPTAAELRRLAIWANYRALVDISANGGYGRFWGPTSMSTATTPWGKAKLPARNISRLPTTAAAARTSACSCRCQPASIRPTHAS